MSFIYRVAGDVAETRPEAGGPWDARIQHGAAPAALAAWAVERCPTDMPMRLARLTVNLLRPVPIAPLKVLTNVARQGRKIQLVEVSLRAGETEVVRAEGLKILVTTPELDPFFLDRPLDRVAPDQAFEISGGPRIICPFLSGISSRLTDGPTRRLGASAMWFRADRRIVEGEAISPGMRAAIAGDFSNGVSAPLEISQWTFVNADMTVSLARLPRGEWILVNAETWLGPDGIGVAFAQLGDLDGYFGRSTQTLVVERRSKSLDQN